MSDRDPHKEPHYILTHISEDHLKNKSEIRIVKQYKNTFNSLSNALERRKHLKIKVEKYHNLNEMDKTIYYVKKLSELDKRISNLNETLSSLIDTKIAHKICHREDERQYREFIKKITYDVPHKSKIEIFIKNKFPNVYRELCYKRVKKLHTYFECGAITEEEFNKLKQEILRKIK